MVDPRSDFRGAAAFRTSRLARCPQAMKNRIHLYDHHVGLVVEHCAALPTAKARTRHFYCASKALHPAVAGLPALRDCGELFYSVYCRLFDHRSLTPERLFILAPSQSAVFVPFPARWRKTFPRSRLGISADARYQRSAAASRWQNKSRDIHYIVRHLTETRGQTISRKVIYRWRTNCFTA